AMSNSNSVEIVSIPQAVKLKEYIFRPEYPEVPIPWRMRLQELISQRENTKEFIFWRERPQSITDMVGTQDATRIVIPSDSGYLTIIDTENDCVSAVIEAERSAIDIMAISPNGKWLATGGQDLSVHRVRDGSLIATHGMNRRVKSLAWSPDSSSIVAGGD